mmetsp:Transcript_17549/g.32477  ORF Transcript_17549/g.32477 Transcript_17549/m.32477 type:complete len:363 (+) Transcript_17549:249-1337(+)
MRPNQHKLNIGLQTTAIGDDGSDLFSDIGHWRSLSSRVQVVRVRCHFLHSSVVSLVRWSQYTTMKYSKAVIEVIGCCVASKNERKKLNQRAFVAFYNRTPEEAFELWEYCAPLIEKKTHPKHLFWSLMFMKLYVPIDCLSIMLDTCVPTLTRWIWLWIETIANRHVEVIHWTRRYRNAPNDIWCMVTVDGTDFRIAEPTPFSKQWKSPKGKGAAVKYEVAISIYSGDIVWVYGPHEGSKHDYKILKEKLMKMLDKDEMVEADAGYGLPGKGGIANDGIVRSKNDYQSEEEKHDKSVLRARHETVNHRFKTWGILKQDFRNQKELHMYVFYAIAVMTQMSIDNGDVLFGFQPETLTKQERYYI